MKKSIFFYTLLLIPTICLGATDSAGVVPLSNALPNVDSAAFNPSSNIVSNQQYWSGNHGAIVSCGANTISCPDINGNYASGGNTQPPGTQCPNVCWVSRTVTPSYTSNYPVPVTQTTDAVCPPSYAAVAYYQAGSDVVMSTNNPNIPATTPSSFYPKGIDEYNQYLMAGYSCSPASALPRGINFLNLNSNYDYQGGINNPGGGQIYSTFGNNSLNFQACFNNTSNQFVIGQGAQGFVPYLGQPTDTINPYLLNTSGNNPASTIVNVGGVVIPASYTVTCFDSCSGQGGNGYKKHGGNDGVCTTAQSEGITSCCTGSGVQGVSISVSFEYLSCSPVASGTNGNVGLNYTAASIPTVAVCVHAKPVWQPINPVQ